jgi:hypothetical protein
MAIPVFTQSLFRGDQHKFRFQVMDELTGTPQNTASWMKFWVTGKARLSDADPGVIALTTGGGGIAAIDTSVGLYEATLSSALTASLDDQIHRYVTDIQGKDGAGTIYTLARGQIVVSPDVQRGTT